MPGLGKSITMGSWLSVATEMMVWSSLQHECMGMGPNALPGACPSQGQESISMRWHVSTLPVVLHQMLLWGHG